MRMEIYKFLPVGTSISLLLFITIVSLEPSLLPFSFGQNSTSLDLFPANSEPYGLLYEEHLINYYKYILPIPLDRNPIHNSTVDCNYGQNTSDSKIFYLNGNEGGETVKTCTIPEGLGLFIPIITVEISTAELNEQKNRTYSINELDGAAKDDQDSVDLNLLYLKINDKEYSSDELTKFRIHTKKFEITFPENAIFGAIAGPATSVADGYHIITHPLSAGNYTIQFKGALGCFGSVCLEPSFVTDNTYHILVTKQGHEQ